MVADVGGTNTRLALFDPSKNEFRHTQNYTNRDFESFAAVIAAWRNSLPEAFPRQACLAVAALPQGDMISMFNMSWSFSMQETARQFGFKKVRWMNDFAANACSLPHLASDEVELLYGKHSGSVVDRKLAVIGPGTGLGGATMGSERTIADCCACEPGHMSLSPSNSIEIEIFKLLLQQHSHIYAELLLSGPGLLRLYQTLAIISDSAATAIGPAQVTEGALTQSDPLAVRALNIFCALLGSTAGDFVLANGAYGGIYLAGGIVPRILALLKVSDFYQRFCDKGGMSTQMTSIPVFAILHPHPGLLGAARVTLS